MYLKTLDIRYVLRYNISVPNWYDKKYGSERNTKMSLANIVWEMKTDLFNRGSLVCKEAERQAKNPSSEIKEGAFLLWDDGIAMQGEALALYPLYWMLYSRERGYTFLLRKQFDALKDSLAK